MQQNLQQLFDEKVACRDTIQETTIKKKKIKKKDIEVLDISERELKYYEYDIYNNIKIYNGVIKDIKESVMNSIKLFKMMSPIDKITELVPSTLTSRGNFSNIEFSEENFIKKLDIPSKEYCKIVKIGCNYGEIYSFPSIYINYSIENMLKSISANQDVKIGCWCREYPLDTSEINILFKLIEDEKEQCMLMYENNVKSNLLAEHYLTKKKINKIIKNFDIFFNFKYLSKDDIDELYIVIEKYLKGNDLKYLNDYLDKIQKILNSFAKYENECLCKTKIGEDLPETIQDTNHKKSNSRGRKPKNKKNKRKIQGTGMYFSSQVTFEIYNSETKKISKIKVFRNGNFQVPGIKRPDMQDLIEPITILKNYLNAIKEKSDKNVEIPYMLSVMRNYTCKLKTDNVSLVLNKLEDVLYYEKGLKENVKSLDFYIKFLDSIKNDNLRYDICKYMNFKLINISEITNNSERYPGILVKFNKPIPNKENKKITIKILSSGKINFDGANSELEVTELYYWLQYIMHKYWSEISFDPNKKYKEIISSDSEEYESIYDQE